MGHKRKDTISQKPVEWGKHLHPYEKNQVARSERRAAKTFIQKSLEDSEVSGDGSTKRFLKQPVTAKDLMGM